MLQAGPEVLHHGDDWEMALGIWGLVAEYRI